MIRFAAVSALLFVFGCGGDTSPPEQTPERGVEITTVGVDDIAERFVKLGLALGEYDKAYVDAYHGPDAWTDAVKQNLPSLDGLKAETEELLEALSVLSGGNPDARSKLLEKQILAANTRIRMAQGEVFSFDEETRLIYDAVAPRIDLAELDAALAEIDALLAGDGSLFERITAFKDQLAIPTEKIEVVMDAAIAECRRRTVMHYDLPSEEKFSMRLVNDKPWSGYNWYQGEYRSNIEINTDLPIEIGRAVDLGCHEGYPGHHVWNLFVDRDFLRREGWIEYSIYPLFSPQSLIGEGSANYGIDLAFPDGERVAFERDVLMPLAGIDPALADLLGRFRDLAKKLSHAENSIARDYLDGVIDRNAAVEQLMKYGLHTRERSEQRVDFFETYRGYIINYTLGQDLVRSYVDEAVANGMSPWDAFELLLTTPVSASDLVKR